jgi:hypothetical protein
MALTLAASMRRELSSPHFSRNTKLLAHRAFIAAARRHRATWWLGHRLLHRPETRVSAGD